MKKSRRDPCERCRTLLRPGRVTVHSGGGKKLTIIENVPASICPRCRYQEFSGEVVRRLERAETRRAKAKRRVTVPILTFGMLR